jgi:hypothetical protein
VRNLEGLYAQMWQDYCRGDLPVPDLTNLQLYGDIGCDADHENRSCLQDDFYRAQLEYRNATARLPADSRLWTSPPPDLARAA